MYGLVNKAIEGLVTEQFGADTWARILERANLEGVGFIGMDPYPDEVTYALVGAASEVLATPADALLEAFGVYWTRYVGTRGYGALMSLEGRDLGDFLRDLDDMHARIAMTMPELSPPAFTVEGEAGEYVLHYFSDRPGLAPMVVGLLRGLLDLKGATGSITRTERREDGADHDVFRICVDAA